MSKITIQNAKKQYGDTTVIEGLNLEIRDGELFTLLGPSGCGKTTLLRMIAGFNSIEGGDFYFNEERINDKEPSKRNIGMVFQNYAIFPHMTVAKNVAYGLKNRKTPKDEIARETDRFLEIMQIKQYADRLPENLSGGQQQRVALARALVIKPDVLLMDEPLSNLDAKLRLEMRQAIRKIQREVGITTVYVTHDQEEAMSISDTIAVMNAGKIQHIGTPRDIYQRPANTFVATFIGRTNILDARMEQGTLVFPTGERFTRDSWRTIPDGPVKVSVRPEEFVVHHADEKAGGLSAVLEDSDSSNYYVVVFNGRSRNEYNTVNVRHILIQPEASELSEDDEGYEDDVAAKDAEAAQKAQDILDEWKAGDATEDSFAALANEYSQDPGSNTTGGLYEQVYQGQMVTEFNDWCFDPARQTGDTGIIHNESTGYHVMYFVGYDQPYWEIQVSADLVNDAVDTFYEEKTEGYTAEQSSFGMSFVG